MKNFKIDLIIFINFQDESDDLPPTYLPDESGTSIGINSKWKGQGQQMEEYEDGAFSDIDQYDDLH